MPHKRLRQSIGCLVTIATLVFACFAGYWIVHHVQTAGLALRLMPADDKIGLCIIAAAALHAIMSRRR